MFKCIVGIVLSRFSAEHKLVINQIMGFVHVVRAFASSVYLQVVGSILTQQFCCSKCIGQVTPKVIYI